MDLKVLNHRKATAVDLVAYKELHTALEAELRNSHHNRRYEHKSVRKSPNTIIDFDDKLVDCFSYD